MLRLFSGGVAVDSVLAVLSIVMVCDHMHAWHADAEIRFHNDEPARHAVMDLMGDLALLGDKGHSGLPCGHLVAFNASHDLVMDFVIHCAEAIEAGDVQEFPFMLLPSEVRTRNCLH